MRLQCFVGLALIFFSHRAAAQTTFSAGGDVGALVIGRAPGALTFGGSGAWTFRDALSLRGHAALTGLEFSEPGFLAGISLAGGYRGESIEVDLSVGVEAMSVAVLGQLNKGRINGFVPIGGIKFAFFGDWVRLADGLSVAGSCLWVTRSLIWEGIGCTIYGGPVWRLGKE